MILLLLKLLAITFLSALVHEAGHAFYGWCVGLKLRQFQIFAGEPILKFGVFAIGYLPMVSWVIFDDTAALSRKEKIVVAAGGCLMQQLFSSIIYLLLKKYSFCTMLSNYMLLMSLVNLIPFKNSDGAHLLRLLLKKK